MDPAKCSGSASETLVETLVQGLGRQGQKFFVTHPSRPVGTSIQKRKQILQIFHTFSDHFFRPDFIGKINATTLAPTVRYD